jgi:cytochrome c
MKRIAIWSDEENDGSSRMAKKNRMWQKHSFYVAATIFAYVAFVTSVSFAVAQQRVSTSQGDAVVDGKSLFVQCSGCHSLSPSHNDRGPNLYHLLGRKAGTVPGYNYSLAMKKAAIVWRDATLARFLADPQHVVPGTTMIFAGVTNPQQTKALLDYLRTATR